jgi:hypothetical protein
MKQLLRRVGCWVRRIASLGVDRNLVEGSLVGNKVIPVDADALVEEGSRVQIEHKRFVGEGRTAEDKENPVAGSMETPAVVKMVHLVVGRKPGVAESKASLVVEGRVNPVVEDKVIPEVVSTVVDWKGSLYSATDKVAEVQGEVESADQD